MSLDIIPSDSQSPAAWRILLLAQEQLDLLCMPARLKPADYFMGRDGRERPGQPEQNSLTPTLLDLRPHCFAGDLSECVQVGTHPGAAWMHDF